MRAEFGDLEALKGKPVPMAYVATHPVCGHLAAIVTGKNADVDIVVLAAGMVIDRVPETVAFEWSDATCSICRPGTQPGLGL